MRNKKILALTIILASSMLMATMFVPQLSYANGTDIEDEPQLESPIKGKNFTEVLLRILQVILALVDIFALFMFILGGFEFLISAGNPKMIQRAKDTLVWATLGILVITLSYSILKFVFEEIQKGI